MSAPVPGWLQLLRVSRYGGSSDHRLAGIAKRTKIPYRSVAAIFRGELTPELHVLNKLIHELEIDPHDADIMRRDLEGSAPEAPMPPLEFRSDAQIIADAIVQAAQIIAAALEQRRE